MPKLPAPVLKNSAKSTRQGTHALKARREEINRDGKVARVPSVPLRAGELVLEGLNAAEREIALALVDKAVADAARRNPRVKLLAVEIKGSRVRIAVSDGHFAHALGRKIHSARKGGELTATWADFDVPVRVAWKKLK